MEIDSLVTNCLMIIGFNSRVIHKGVIDASWYQIANTFFNYSRRKKLIKGLLNLVRKEGHETNSHSLQACERHSKCLTCPSLHLLKKRFLQLFGSLCCFLLFGLLSALGRVEEEIGCNGM